MSAWSKLVRRRIILSDIEGLLGAEPGHMPTHTGEKTYLCNMCDYRSTQNSHLTPHMMIHTGGKEFMCDKCNKQFRHSSTLSKLFKIHAGVKPCACSACDYRSSQEWNLDSRMQSRHMCEKPYGCDGCGGKFQLTERGRVCDELCINEQHHTWHTRWGVRTVAYLQLNMIEWTRLDEV